MALLRTFFFHPLAWTIFLPIIQVATSFNYVFLIHIAYVIPVASYYCLKRVLLRFKKGNFAPPAPPAPPDER